MTFGCVVLLCDNLSSQKFVNHFSDLLRQSPHYLHSISSSDVNCRRKVILNCCRSSQVGDPLERLSLNSNSNSLLLQ